MSNPESVETILRELYQSDPSLKAYEADLPTLITTLQSHRPDAEPREVFMSALRRELLQDPRFASSTPRRHPLSWWALHLAPIGVAALVVITLMPTSQPYTVPDGGNLTPGSTEEIPATFMSDTVEPMSDDTGTSAKFAPNDSMRGMEMSTSEFYSKSDRLIVPTQDGGMTVLVQEVLLTVDGYIAIYTTTPGEERLIGASPLIPRGVTANIYIRMKELLTPGTTYRAEIFEDDGDRIFSLPRDQSAYDANTGIKIETYFDVAE